ncbi:annexin D4-like [Aristolochia californica]|uniref:annexin D4-like n=1 Tax=Aristolochia californica TaxID=171875 RepID=UPI0035E2E009
MATPLASNDLDALTKAFSGFGVDESFIVSVSAKWQPDHLTNYRKSCSEFFRDDERSFQRWEVAHIAKLKTEFSRFKKAVLEWAMHPWERDARFANEVVHKGPPLDLLIEVACTRSSEELLGARKAYHSIFHHSLEEDVASHLLGNSRKLFVALVSSYRYEGPWVNPELAISEAKILGKAVKETGAIHNEDVVRILSTRSKKQLKLTFDQYNEIFGSTIDKDLENDLILQSTVECLASPATYYSKVLAKALSEDADETAKKALTRVVVTRAVVDLKEIKEEYNKIYGVSVVDKVAEVTSGNYKDFLLALIARDT